MPRKKSRKSRAMGGEVEEGPSHNPQYEDVTQESDLESVASSSASQSKGKRMFSWTLEQEEDLITGYITRKRLSEKPIVAFTNSRVLIYDF